MFASDEDDEIDTYVERVLPWDGGASIGSCDNDDLEHPDAELEKALGDAVVGMGDVGISLEVDEHDVGSAVSSGDATGVSVHAHGLSSAASSSAAPAPIEPWTRCSEASPLAYIYLDERSGGRLLRGSPKNSMTIRCYRHPSCQWLVNLRRAPTDDVFLREWLFAVDTSTDAVEQRALAIRHVAITRNRWGPSGTG